MKKSLYLLKGDVDRFDQLIIESESDRELVSTIVGTRGSIPHSVCAIWAGGGLPKPDIAILNGFVMVCSSRVKNALDSSTFMDGNEFLTINVDGESWYIMNVCNKGKGLLNHFRSKVSYYNDGQVKWIDKHVFKKCYGNDAVFYLEEQPTAYFSSKGFVDVLEINHFHGILAEECKIIKNLIF